MDRMHDGWFNMLLFFLIFLLNFIINLFFDCGFRFLFNFIINFLLYSVLRFLFNNIIVFFLRFDVVWIHVVMVVWLNISWVIRCSWNAICTPRMIKDINTNSKDYKVYYAANTAYGAT